MSPDSICVWLLLLVASTVRPVQGGGIDLDQPISVACAENFTITWRDARGAPAPSAGDTVTIELHSHLSSTVSMQLDVIGVVSATAYRFVWSLPEVVPVAWEQKDLIIKAYRTTMPAINNNPTNSLWSVFSVVCLAPVISIKQPPRVRCGETYAIEWVYLFPEKQLWSTADRLTVELFAYLPLGIDPKLATLSTSVSYPATTFQYTVPKTIPGGWPTPNGQNRVYFVVSKTGDRQQTSDRACLFCPYPFLTCGDAVDPGVVGPVVPGGGVLTSATTRTDSTRTFVPGGGPAAIDPGLIGGAAAGAIIVVIIVAVLAWYFLVKRKERGDSARISVENSLHGSSSPPQSPRAGVTTAAAIDKGQMSQMQSFPDGIGGQTRSMTQLTQVTQAAPLVVQPSYSQQQMFIQPASAATPHYPGLPTQREPVYAAGMPVGEFYGPKSNY
jgi:hypothetical protein